MKQIVLCNGKREECRKTYCSFNDTGSCKYTTDEKYALNPPDKRKFDMREDGNLWEVDDEPEG